MSEDVAASLRAIGCPPDVADAIAMFGEREEAARQRLLRLAKYDGPVELRKVSE